MTKLKKVHADLKKLESYALPKQYLQCNGNCNIDPDILSRHEEAKSRYLQQRVSELLMEFVGTFDGKTFQFPPPHHNEKNRNEDTIHERVKNTSKQLYNKINNLRAAHENFQERKKELKRIIEDTESKQEDTLSTRKNDDDDDDSNDDTQEMFEQEKRLLALVRKRTDLQAKLERMKEAKMKLERQNKDYQSKWDAMNQDCPYANSKDFSQALEKIRKDKENMSLTTQQLKEKTLFYKSITEAFIELGGIKILTVDNERIPGNEQTKLLVKFLLIDQYVLSVSLSPLFEEKKPIHDHLIIENATLSAKDSAINTPVIKSKNRNVSLPLPPLNDVIAVAQTLPKSENIRFLLREVSSRIRATQVRTEELALLRNSFLTKIMKSGQEVVCSLNEGITVVIKMTADCPLTNGSAYIEEIVGIGGWDQNILEDMKSDVNAKASQESFCYHAENCGKEGPIGRIMDILAKEVKNMQRPLTPRLPVLTKNMKDD